MTSIRSLLLVGLVLAASLYFVHAQQMVSFSESAQPIPEATDEQVMLQAVEMVSPVPADSLPETGTFWSAQHAPGSAEPWPPLPGNMLGLPVWPMGDGVYLLNDTNVDYAGLQAADEAAAELEAALVPRMRMSMMASSLASSYAYGNPVYLTNLAVCFTNDGSMTASFSIAGGTNFVPYDILMTTNLVTPVSQWNWLGIGYTSNNYTFYEQPSDLAFYRLESPQRTMVVPWGKDNYGQCDLWPGITNAVQVTGGTEFSLALLTDGTVTGWGYDGATSSELVPTNLVGVTMIASGWQHNVALLTNGTVTAWGDDFYDETDVPDGLTNVTVISAQGLHSLALSSNGTVAAWGYESGFGETDVPPGLSNVTAIAAGAWHNLVVSNGIVVAWGYNGYGQCTVPAGLSNVVDVAAGFGHSVALKNDGTVVCWGDNTQGEATVPGGLTNVVAIAAGGYFSPLSGYTLALKQDGTVVVWGDPKISAPLGGLNNVIAIGGGSLHALAIRTGPPTPVITLEPTDVYQAVGSNVTFNAEGVGLYGVTYQWQTNGVNLSGATNTALTVTNVQATSASNYDMVVTDNGGMGSLASSNANLFVITPPVIISQSPMPTNQVFGVPYQINLTLSVVATAPGTNNGFPLHYQWRRDGTNISGATAATYNFNGLAGTSDTYSVLVTNAAGSVSADWSVTITNAINVTNDLLLVYNSNSSDSSNLCAYYLAHRPMVGGANVLGVACDVGEFTTSTNCNLQIVAPVLNWLTNNPAKLPQYVILFYDIPTRLTDLSGSAYANFGSVGYHLHNLRPDWQPFVNYINAGSFVDCEAYVDKVTAFGSNYSPGQLVISASAGNYGNTNYVLDNVRHGTGYGIPFLTEDFDYSPYGSTVSNAISGLTANGVSSSAIDYLDGLDTILTNTTPFTYISPPHITNAANVTGYICWGGHSNWGTNRNDANYSLDGNVLWSGNSSWWIIKTLESYNGQRVDPGQGTFMKWFSSNAFGGTNYSNTPVGACSNVEEPGLEGSTTISAYFSLWASGNNFGICAWNAVNTHYFQAVGDPFVTR